VIDIAGNPNPDKLSSFITLYKTEGAIMSRTSTVANKKNTSKQATTHQTGDGENRQQMIATAAYFRAERHSFDGAAPVADWLAAEEEIDAMFKSRKDISLY
jgi:Protein of unknown function (DUF2934)